MEKIEYVYICVRYLIEIMYDDFSNIGDYFSRYFQRFENF